MISFPFLSSPEAELVKFEASGQWMGGYTGLVGTAGGTQS